MHRPLSRDGNPPDLTPGGQTKETRSSCATSGTNGWYRPPTHVQISHQQDGTRLTSPKLANLHLLTRFVSKISVIVWKTSGLSLTLVHVHVKMNVDKEIVETTRRSAWYDHFLIITACKLRRLCFYTCLSVHGGVVSQHALQVSVGRGCIPACLAGFQAHT